MTTALDPEFEQLHLQHREVVSHAPSRREATVEGIAAALFLAVSVALVALAGPDLYVNWALLVPLAVVFIVFWQVEIPVGLASTTPLQVAFVPLWFAVDPALLPVTVASFAMLGTLVARGHDWQRAWIGIPDAWYAVGPAVVLGAFAVAGAPVLDAWPIYIAALAAQILVDTVSGTIRSAAAAGFTAEQHWRPMLWLGSVDIALAPIGLLLALALPASPWLVLTVLPVGVLAALFARERDGRIEHALALSSAYRGTAQLMGDVLEADDQYTGGEHTQGVVDLSLAVGRHLGLDPVQMRRLEFGALLHDIGKLRVPNEIINKPGKLNESEWDIVRQHPRFGEEMLERVGGTLADAGRIVRAHHERWDGAGYPDGLAGKDIPIEARVITVCDSFSAMTTTRSYRRAMEPEAALNELFRCAGAQFDPAVVKGLEVILGVLPATERAAPASSVPAQPAVTRLA